ncbi:MAG TPA: DUF4388 domain-containing protein [Acidimicrobiales bacterium]|nr:DUF4388 domain-containing protein [Acidimicrobiales bacterium]
MASDPPALTGTLVDFRPRTLLHFLGLTGKSGVLRVDDIAVSFRNGRVLGDDAVDEVVRMLRTPQGRFRFEESATVGGDVFGRHIAEVLAEAGEAVMDWEEVAQVVPSMAVVVTLSHGDDDVHLSADAWTLSTAVAAGHTTPAQLMTQLGWPALRVCRAVSELVTGGRAAVAPPVRERRASLRGRAETILTATTERPLWPGHGQSESRWRTPWHDAGY